MAEPFWAKVRSSGRVTIPYELRELLEIKEGDLVKVQLIEPTEQQKQIEQPVEVLAGG